MNKKLFTLAAALMMGSAFTVNAQKKEVVDKTALNGGTWYFLAVPGVAAADANGDISDRIFVGGKELADSDGNKHTILDNAFLKQGTATVAALSQDENTEAKDHYDSYLWKVSMSSMNGQNYYTLTNKKTGKQLAFNATNGGAAIASDHSVNAVTWAGKNLNGSYNTKGVITTKTGVQIAVSNTTVSYIASGTPLSLYTIDEATVDSDDLNKGLGDGFALSFPDVKPQPAKNIFDQKLTAVNFNGDLYFAVSMPANGIRNINDFKASTFVAVSPVENFGINALPQGDGVGFDFITVSGKNLVSGTTEKAQVNIKNAQFKVTVADPINKPDQYTIQIPSAYVKKDATKDAQTAVSVYVDAVTSVGVTYVTTTKEATKQKFVFSESNMVKAADILSEDAPSIFNIQFLSGAQEAATNPEGSEYAKFLGLNTVSGPAYQFFAEGAAYLNLDAPQNQWVITNVEGNEITFTSRERSNVEFTAKLRKTDDENVYALSSDDAQSFSWGYLSDAGYQAATVRSLSALTNAKIRLYPVVIDVKAGIADYTKFELSQPAKITFSVADNKIAKDLYVAWGTQTGGVYDLDASQKATDAIKWDIVKNASAQDSISNTLTYAIQATVKGEVVVKNDQVVDKAFTTYKFTTSDGANIYYLTDAYKLTTVKANAANFIVRENVNGTVAIIPMSTIDNEYESTMTAGAKTLAFDPTASAVKSGRQLEAAITGKWIKPSIVLSEPTPSLESVARHASFQNVNGGFLAVGADRGAMVAATSTEAPNLTFWLDTVDVEEPVPAFYISQSPSVLKADEEVRNYLWNPADSAVYFNNKTASYIYNAEYFYNNDIDSEVLKAMFKSATAADVEDDEAYKFQIVLADEAVADEYIIRSVADGSFLSSINGKVILAYDEPLVVKLGEGDATANEAIEAEAGVQVIGGQGVVTVQGAAGKVITVANILGQTIANQVAASDNVTIAAPAGVVVVAVDGEATKVVVK